MDLWKKTFRIVFYLFHLEYVLATLGSRRLYNDLLLNREGYKYARPVRNLSEPVIVYMNLSLTQILEVDEKNQIIILNMWVSQEWKDPNFKWNPRYYENVNEILVPQDEIWKPDLVLYNNAGGDWDLASSSNTRVRIRSDSMVVWRPPIIYYAACDIDVEFFPFDTQNCTLKMGTWTHDGYAIDLRHSTQKRVDNAAGRNHEFDRCESTVDYAMDLSEYQPNVEWDLIKVTAKRNIVKYACCKEPFLDITFSIQLRRKTLFYGINLICPCMTISILTVLGFYLPSDSQEKMALGISVLIALTVFILLVFDLTPSTSLVVPLITKYLLFTIILITASIVASIVVLNVRYCSPDTNKMSPWVRRLLIETMPRYLFCIKRPTEEGPTKLQLQAHHYLRQAGLLQVGNNSRNVCRAPSGHGVPEGEDCYRCKDEQLFDKFVKRRAALPNRETAEIELALAGVQSIAGHMQKESEVVEVEEDWKFVALVLDRLFLIVFGVAVFIGTVGLFMQAPTLTDNQLALDRTSVPTLERTVNYTRSRSTKFNSSRPCVNSMQHSIPGLPALLQF